MVLLLACVPSPASSPLILVLLARLFLLPSFSASPMTRENKEIVSDAEACSLFRPQWEAQRGRQRESLVIEGESLVSAHFP